MKDKKTKAIIFAVTVGTFMSALDGSVVNLAMPVIQAYFGVSMSSVEWIVTSFLLVVSTLLLTYGRLADMLGHKKVYLTGFIIFTFTSLLCGLASSVEMLVVFRVLQAIGAGMLFSTGPAIITNAVPPEHRGKGLSRSAIAVALGLSAGPLVGGVLSTLLGWQSIFYINVPIGIFGIILVWRVIPEDREKIRVPFDIPGALLIFAALMLILLPLNISGDYDIHPGLFAALIAGGVVLMGVFILHEYRCPHPMLKLSLYKNRVFAASTAASFFIYMSQNMLIFIVPFYLQSLMGYSAFESGLLFLPMPIATMCIAPISGIISDRYDTRYISSLGALIMAVGLFALSFLNMDSTRGYLIGAMAVCGLGFGLFQTPNNSAIMGNASPENRGIASGILATMRNMGLVLGVALSTAVFTHTQGQALETLAGQVRPQALLEGVAFVRGLRAALMVSALLALISMAASLLKGRVKTEAEKQAEREQAAVN